MFILLEWQELNALNQSKKIESTLFLPYLVNITTGKRFFLIKNS
jgi:hypothetical protein